jgi:hypothetical protein
MIYLYSVILFYLINLLYIKIWKKFSKLTPNGVGILFIIPLTYFTLKLDLNFFLVISLILFTLIYFLDDVSNLNFYWRLLIQIATSAVIYFSFFTKFNFIEFALILLFFFILTNTLNFHDGADLNISTLLFLIFFVIFYFTRNLIIKNITELILLYLLIFKIFNRKINNLYFGDVGCFISSVLIFLFVINDIKNLLMIKVILSVILFPVIEVFLITFYRIYKKENLLSRNYYYLYQTIARKTKWKMYLIPNIFFAFTNYLIFNEINFSIQIMSYLILLNTALIILLHFIFSKFRNRNEN